jgi:hypothetical protein
MEKDVNKSFRSGYTKGLGFGLFLMLIGVLFLGFNFGILPKEMKEIVFSWPMILVFFGVVNYLNVISFIRNFIDCWCVFHYSPYSRSLSGVFPRFRW